MTKIRSNYLIFLGLIFFPFLISCSDEELRPSDTGPKGTEEQKLQLHYDLYKAHRDQNVDSALLHLNLLKEEATINNQKKWVGRALMAKGKILKDQGFLGDAAFNFFEAAKLFNTIKEPLYTADNFEYLGNIFTSADDFHNAVPYFKRSLELYNQHGTDYEKALAHYNLGVCYLKISSYNDAFSNIYKAIELANTLSDSLLLSESHNIIGAIYFKQGKFELAREHYNLSLTYAKFLPDEKRITAIALNNIGESFLKEGKLDQAEVYLNNSLRIKEELQNVEMQRESLLLLAELATLEGDTSLAINFLERSLSNIDPNFYNRNVGDGLTHIIKILGQNQQQAKTGNGYQKLSHYSTILATNYNKLREIKEELEKLNKQYMLQNAVEKYTLNSKIEHSEEKRQQVRLAVLAPVLIFIGFAVALFWALRKILELKANLRHVGKLLNE